MKKFIEQHVLAALEKAVSAGKLPAIAENPPVIIEIPDKKFGDFSVTVAMALAKPMKQKPRSIAEAIISEITRDPFETVEIAGPGYINFRLKPAEWRNHLRDILAEGDSFGKSSIGKGKKVMVEFVSANPTGPLHIGHGRGAIIGDVLANLMTAIGYDVHREYYINNVGLQMKNLGESVYARYCGLFGKEYPFPENGYKGDYIAKIAEEIKAKKGDIFLNESRPAWQDYFSDHAGGYLLAWIKTDLDRFGVRFDKWYSERTLHDSGKIESALESLKGKGIVYEQDGALWLKSSAYGDEKDRVVKRSTGETTYFAADIAYHLEKYERGFEILLDIWGADHHGYVPRLKAVLEAAGRDPDSLVVRLVQFVSLKRGGETVSMSTRSGEFTALDTVLDEVGTDAARFFFLMRSSDSALDFDLDLAKSQTSDNPVYYVQYAHARCSNIITEAAKRGVNIPDANAVSLDALELAEEFELIRQLLVFPETVENSAKGFDTHIISYYLIRLCEQFHSYYNKNRVVSDSIDLTQARLTLVLALRQVIRNGLKLLGVTAPDKM